MVEQAEAAAKPTKVLPPAAGMGRKKGVPNKNTRMLKEALLQAANEAGGKEGLVGYLRTQATESPAAFLSLLGKVLPLQVSGEDGEPIKTVTTIVLQGVAANGNG